MIDRTKTPLPFPTRVVRGNFLGTGILGAVEFFIGKYGNAAAHATVAKLPRELREHVTPNAPNIGILGAKKYPYPFVGELFRTMALVVRAPNEDQFLRELATAGMDATLNTVARVALRYMVSPQTIAQRAQELWNTFHDAGVVRVQVVNDREYVAEMIDWPNHDVTVCKICAEARRRILERTGVKNVHVSREKCQAWGHPICSHRVRWT